MKKLYFILLPMVALIIGYCWYFSDSKVVTRKTELLLKCFDKENASGMVGGAMQISNFRDLLDDEVVVQFPSFLDQYAVNAGIPMKRSKIVGTYKGLIATCTELKLSSKSISVSSIKDGVAITSASFHAVIKHSQYQLEEELLVTFTFRDTDQGWLVSEVVIARNK